MAALKSSVADALQVAKTPSLPNDVVRLQDQQAALANVPTVGQMTSQIADVAQSPTQLETDNSIIASLISPNSFQIGVRLAPNGLIQAAQTGLSGVQSVVSAWTEIVLGYEQVSSVVVTRNLISNNTVTFTGVLGVDYYLDAFNGNITIVPNSGLINSGESPQTTQIEITFNCAEIDSGGGLQVVGGSSGGVEVIWGEGHNQVPRGDTVLELLENMHLPAAPDPAATTTTTTVDELQRIRTEVKLSSTGHIISEGDGSGIGVDIPGVTAAVEASIGYASSSSAGLMTPGQVAILGALENELPASWGTTDSMELGQDASGLVTGNIITGVGITVGYVTSTGNTGTGLFLGEPIWFDLSLNPSNWPAGWPNVLFWGIGVSGGTITFSIYQDSAGSTLLASGTTSVSGLLAASTPQTVTLYNPSLVIVGSLAINTDTAYPVASNQEIVLTPQGVSVDLTTVALKSTTDAQQAEIAALQAADSSQSSAITFLESEVATLGGNLLTPANLNDFNCLATLLEKWEFAHRLIPSLRLELPILAGGNPAAPAMVPERQIVSAGSPSTVYTLNFQIAGVAQLKFYWGAAAVQGTSNGRCVNGGTAYDAANPVTSPWPPSNWPPPGQNPLVTTIETAIKNTVTLDNTNTWALVISDDGTGTQQTYYLNAAVTNADQNDGPVALNYTITGINVKGVATVSLIMVSAGTATLHSIVVPDAGPYPESFPGYFMQVDPSFIANVCPVGDIADDGNVDGIALFGASARKDLDVITGGPTGSNNSSANSYPALNFSPEYPAWNGPYQEGTNGTDIPSGNGTASTANQPIIDLPRDLLRLGLIDGGNADDWVYDILVNGNDIWVAGAFSRWGNTPCPGLVRLDHLGRLAYDFNNYRAAFSEPVRHIALTSDGNIAAASIFSAMYQNGRSAPVHKILRDGSEDETFNAPDQIAINDTAHPNLIIDVACLHDGKVAILTPRGLTVLNGDGSVFSQQDSGGTDMFLALLAVPGTTSLLLSSHAWSQVNQPCLFGAATIPRGLKLLDESGSNFQVDATWANAAYIGLPALGAGTGAMASCMRAIPAPDNSYFIVGNGLSRYNGIDTSWNTQILGNLLRYSEDMAHSSAWLRFGTMSVTDSATVPAGVTGNAQSAILGNTGGVGFQAFLQQSMVVAPNATTIWQFYLKKQGSVSSYPTIQMQFAGSSAGASSGGGGGAALEAYAWLDPSGVNANPLVVNVAGNGSPSCTMVTAPNDSGWWLVTMTMTNASTDTDLNITVFPAYSTTWGGTSNSATGSIQISAPEVIYNYWSTQYVPTTSSPALPTETANNASRFQGLYKILFDGAADPNFNCCMTYGDDGMAIPFAIDGHGNIYCGGPITSIKDSSGVVHNTTPWMLYKLNSNGQFLAQYNLFDDAVLVARITPYGNLVVGGKFQFYGSYGCGRFVMIDPWGNLIRDPIVLDDPVFTSSISSFPDVVTLPGLKNKLLLDQWTDPPSEYVWSNSQGMWVQAGSGGFTQLPPVSITTSPSVPPSTWTGSPTLAVTLADAIGGTTIYYTTDGTDPRLTGGTRILYSAPFNISTPTIITAFALLAGYANSVLSTVTFGQTLATPVISPASENISFPVAVTITGPGGAAIWYTTDGTDPTTSGTATLYSTGFNVGTAGAANAVVRAVAKQTGYFPSAVAQANYGDNIMPALVFTPAGGAGVPVSVVIGLPASFTAPYTVYYTTSTTGNPAAPTLLSANAPGPLTLALAVGTAIQAFATSPGWTSTPIASAAYGLAIAAGPTITTPPAGSGLGVAIITAAASGPVGQSIVYTVNGGAPITAASPAGVDLSDVPGVNGAVTITAYSTFPGWSNSPTTTAQIQPLLLSGLIDVNFAPPSATEKVGRMAIFSDPFADIWNTINTPPGLQSTLQENFYSDGTGTAQAPGAATPTQLSFTPASGTFGVIPFIGDAAYKNFLQIGSTSIINNIFESVAYSVQTGLYIAVASAGQIWTSPDGNTWTETKSGLPPLTRVVAANVAACAPSLYTTVFSYDLGMEGVQFPPLVNGYTVTTGSFTGTYPNLSAGNYPQYLTFVGSAGPYPITPNALIGGRYFSPQSVTNTNNSTPAYSGIFTVGLGIILTSQDGVTWTNITGNLPASFEIFDVSVTTASGAAEIEVVGTGGRQFVSAASTPTVWTENTPAANIGANLNSIATNVVGGATQNQLLIGDAGTIFNVNGATLVPNAFDQVPFSRAAVNPLIGQFAFVSERLNGVTEAFTMDTSATPAFTPTGPFPPGVTNLLDICPYQYGFIAVGDQKILLGTMAGGILEWTDITPTTTGGSSSGAGGFGSYTVTGLVNGSQYLASIAAGEALYINGVRISPFDGLYLFTYTTGTSVVILEGPLGTINSTLYLTTLGSNLVPALTLWASNPGGIYDFGSLLTLGQYYLVTPSNTEFVNNLGGVYEFTQQPVTGQAASVSTGANNILENNAHTYVSTTVQQYLTTGPNLLLGHTYTGSSGSSGGDQGPLPFNYKGVTVKASTGEVIVVGDGGIIYGSFNGSIWVWNYSNQQTTPPLPPNEVMRGTFSNLTPGFYDLLIYGHGNTPSENSTFHAYADGVQVKDINGALAPNTVADATFQNTNWQVDRQYVEFSDIETDTGTIAFGVVPTGVASSTYQLAVVQWTEYGTGNGTSSFGTLLGAVASAASYTTTTTNPGVSIGSEATALAVVGNLAAISPKVIPAGVSGQHPGGTANCQRSATRYYLVGIVNSNSGFINAVQLSRRKGAGVRMGIPAIAPETLDNLPFPAVPGGLDLVGIFLAPSDVALGIAPISTIYFSVVGCSYSQYETYLASGAGAAGLSADPTTSTGTPYTAPFGLASATYPNGCLVRAIATCIGRTNSGVGSAFYWPPWPNSSSQGQ